MSLLHIFDACNVYWCGCCWRQVSWYLEESMQANGDVLRQAGIHAMRVQVGCSRIQDGRKESIEAHEWQDCSVEHPAQDK